MDASNSLPNDAAGADFSVVKALTALAKRKLLIGALSAAGALAALTMALLSPSIYRSGTQLLPPAQPQAGAAAILAQLGGAAAAVTGGSSVKNPNDVYLAMLGSRTVADKLIARFQLRQVYGNVSPAAARATLQGNSMIKLGKDGLIKVEVEDKDPKRAAQLANGYVEELQQLTRVLAVTEAAQRRLFFEKQLAVAKNDLAASERALKGALDTNGVISVDSDSRAVIETVGRLRAQISAKQVQLSSMQAFVTTGNQEFKRAQEELGGLRAELSRLQNGRPGAAAADGQGEGMDKRGLANIQILRDVKYYQMLYELLAKQYEAARLDEAKEASVIQVLDPAIEPERRAKPRTRFMTLAGALAGFLLGVVLAFLLEEKERLLRTPEGASQWAELRLRLGLRGIRKPG